MILNGVQSSLYNENVASVEDFLMPDNNSVTPPDAARAQIAALYDPQTSGGLLLGVDFEKAALLISRLISAGSLDAAIIGTVTDATNDPRIVIKNRI